MTYVSGTGVMQVLLMKGVTFNGVAFFPSVAFEGWRLLQLKGFSGFLIAGSIKGGTTIEPL